MQVQSLAGTRKHICFVAPTAWPVLAGDRTARWLGGADIQQCVLARELVRQGHRASMICMDFGQPEGASVDGVTTFRMCEPDAGLPVLRFVHPVFTTLWRAMKRADADLYYQRAAGALTGLSAAYCRANRRAFIYAAASNTDFDASLPSIRLWRDKELFRWGLRQANVILTQNALQARECSKTFGLPSRLLGNCYEPPPNADHDRRGYVLWAASLRDVKRPELFLELATRLREHSFRLVGGSDHPGAVDRLRRSAAHIRNLEIVGFVPYAEIDRESDGARVLVNTSWREGFPNTFLQAWARGIPTVSFIDVEPPSGVGSVVNVASDMDSMAETVRTLMEDDAVWAAAGERCRAFFTENHLPRHVAAELSCVADEVLGE